jgi:hypothetical protein
MAFVANEFNGVLTNLLCGTSSLAAEHTYLKAIMAFALAVDSRVLIETLGRALGTCETYSEESEDIAEACTLFNAVMTILLTPKTSPEAAVAAIDELKHDDSFAAVFMDLLLMG